MTPFRCTLCQAVVFFENVECGHCGAWLAFDPGQRRMLGFRNALPAAEPAPTVDAAGDDQPTQGDEAVPALRSCANRWLHANCNWLLDDDAPHGLCRSCRLTRTIPDLSVQGNAQCWARIEQAKRRLVYGLDGLGLHPEPRGAWAFGDAGRGLCFDLMADSADGVPVRTGHDAGVVTLNIAEADDAHRESVRVAMGEPVRTLLGHLRHEVAHYLQYRWVESDPARLEQCRTVFGDERQDYAQALARHYQHGPAVGWDQHHITAYASAHPWEDWAETCAHWLQIVDAVETAAAWGLRLDGPSHARPVATAGNGEVATRDLVIAQWLPVAQFLNAMNRSIGVPDSYPFLMPPAVVEKLHCVATLLAEARQRPTLETPS